MRTSLLCYSRRQKLHLLSIHKVCCVSASSKSRRCSFARQLRAPQRGRCNSYQWYTKSSIRKRFLDLQTVRSERGIERLTRRSIESTALRHNLEWSKALKDDVRIQSLEKAIQNGRNRDPHFMYRKAYRLIAEVRKVKDASQEEKDSLIDK
jgi:hypothetical protein